MADCAFCILAFCIGVAMAVASASVCAAEIIDRVLAVAAGELIMLSDVTAARDLGPRAGSRRRGDPIGAVLSALIDRELILAEVDRYAPPEPGADAVDREVQAVRARFATPRGAGRRAVEVRDRREPSARNAARGPADPRVRGSALHRAGAVRRRARAVLSRPPAGVHAAGAARAVRGRARRHRPPCVGGSPQDAHRRLGAPACAAAPTSRRWLSGRPVRLGNA